MKVTKENLADMLMGMWAFNRWTDKLQVLHVDIDAGNTIDSRDTPNIILDILGFPPEGTMPDITDPEDDDEDKGFCRDWYSQQMYDMPKDSEQDRVKAIEIIDALIKETETENGMIEDGRMSFSFKGELRFGE